MVRVFGEALWMKYLYANGCSFTHGDELGDKGKIKDYHYRAINCWVGQLAQIMGISEWENEATGGGSNDRIYRKTIQYTSSWIARGEKPEDLLVILGWTNPTRTEFYHEPRQDPGDEWNNQEMRQFPELEDNYRRSWPTIKRTTHHNQRIWEFIKQYNEMFLHLPSDTTRMVNKVVTLQNHLKVLGFPFLFFNASWVIDTTNSEAVHTTSLIDQKRYLGFDDGFQTMNWWTHEAGYTNRLPKGHPDEAAHKAWADHLYEYMTENNLLEPDQ